VNLTDLYYLLHPHLLKPMSLFPEENILTKEIESWKGFVNSLKSEDDRKLFPKMLEDARSML
jgi:hypothetical protein